MSAVNSSIASAKRIRQKRSQKTYNALIETCFAMLEQREFSEISIAELARKAGYSVGAFYARFKSKDELFNAMIERHIEQRRAVRARQFATEPDESLIREIVEETVGYFWTRRRFWRAALIRSIDDPEFWEPLRHMSHELQDAFIARMSKRAGRPLTKEEDTNVRFAVQLVLGTVNNTIINRPGPIFMGQASFVDGLVRAFRLVSGYDDLVTTPPKRKRAGKRGAHR
ncbi:MAG TPA: TetR/AcrR family transcriptional regulator [Gammaproteobacteria bacterium]|nr:TetR/AcrR family transcriptional regulator [Gammaproteobacteria bacterium]